jgi:hypothetical protein
MKGETRSDWVDDRLVEDFRKWAIEQSKCGFEPECANRIDNEELTPCRDILAARGLSALRKLLPLLKDDDPNVRLNAAGFAFDADPAACRSVLEALIKQRGITALFAWAVWSHHDPQTAPDPNSFLAHWP